ncbi:MAG: hypothetical protein A3F67_06030 [Verrucomicrobia bacterium RIFCSPHIGHO2_12_FULL_41_10]|nr:MAG: hypothetical protein A3F67_06030 [Verrucomicrobia bacterium RIFCSPHIGHO2_12_FULL_41_10]HLB33552.1 hypothetical protein [Chthoniobacterales bacterium]
MRKLAPSEKTLFLALCGALFLALNLWSFKIYLNALQGVQLKITNAKAKIAEEHSILNIADTLKPASTWISQHPLPIWNADQASSELLKQERSQAEKEDLKIIEENLLPPHFSENASSVIVQTKLSGPFTGVVKFLFALQYPTAWRVIDKFTMKSDTEANKVVVDLEIKQFFKQP